MAATQIYHSKKGLQELREELFKLETQERPQASANIAQAREKGDLKENSEYHAARERLAFIEMRIAELRQKIMTGQLIDEDTIDISKVVMLTKVTLQDTATGKQKIYQLVPPQESNLRTGKISTESPIGSNLLGKKTGDIVEVPIPRGTITYKILDITL